MNTTHPLKLPIENKWLNWLICKLTGLDNLRAIYADWIREGRDQYGSEKIHPQESHTQGKKLLEFGLKQLNVGVDWEYEQRLKTIPRSGSLLIVANHPLGGLEGMLLAHALLKIRPDVKVLTNELLLKFPEFTDIFIGVDVLNDNTEKKNRQGMRKVLRHLDNQGAMLIFPAGTVAGLSWKKNKIIDKKWDEIVGRLMQRYRCPCVPFLVKARNSRWFYLSGSIHKRLRTALLGRAMLSKTHQKIKIAVGENIGYKEIEPLFSAQKVTDYLRFCCEIMQKNTHKKVQPAPAPELKSNIMAPEILKQLQILAPYRVLKKAAFSVYCAPFDKLGCVMQQIAISREITFRAVNEGTGKELDNDRFDRYYWHLWVWDDEAQKLVGGYRLGKVDEIVAQSSLDNLYSNSLYHYNEKFAQSLKHAVEVGRSFVSLEYQRHSKALDLLWRGIGAFMVANPEYHTLFGCVSISKDYSSLAQAFLAESLLKHFNAKEEYISSIKAKKPLRVEETPWSENLINALSNVPVINKLLGRIDSGKTIPILIRHYLALNGKFASFSVNEKFNHSLDGLIIVDLRITPEKYLIRYLGKQGAENFLKKWDIYESVA